VGGGREGSTGDIGPSNMDHRTKNKTTGVRLIETTGKKGRELSVISAQSEKKKKTEKRKKRGRNGPHKKKHRSMSKKKNSGK